MRAEAKPYVDTINKFLATRRTENGKPLMTPTGYQLMGEHVRLCWEHSQVTLDLAIESLFEPGLDIVNIPQDETDFSAIESDGDSYVDMPISLPALNDAYEAVGSQLMGRYIKTDRTNTGTVGDIGAELVYDLSTSFPAITSKFVSLLNVAKELLWFLKGEDNIKSLQAEGCKIWDEWAKEDGHVGPIYGVQWVNWPTYIEREDGLYEKGPGINQIQNVVDLLRADPDSRRAVVNAWNVAELSKMALPPCHAFFQFYTRPLSLHERAKAAGEYDLTLEQYHKLNAVSDEEYKALNDKWDDAGVPSRGLSCKLTQRSADWCIGVPYNVESYALLTNMMAQQLNMVPDLLIWSGGDCHVYLNHVDTFAEQLKNPVREFPTLNIKRKPDSIFDYKTDDFELVGYKPGPKITYPVAV